MKTSNFDPRDPYFYNPIINSNFDFWQRIVGTTANRLHNSLPEGYGADRWLSRLSAGVSKSVSIVRSTSLPPTTYPATYSMQFTNNTAVASLPATEYFSPFEQRIEGSIFKPLHGNGITVGLWIYPSFSGTIAFSAQRNIFARSYASTVDVVANQWQYIIKHVPHDTGGPAQTFDNDIGYRIFVGHQSGTTYQASTLDSWQSGDLVNVAGTTNWIGTAGSFIRFAQCQIRSGFRNVAEMRDGYVPHALSYAQELSACQRYFEKSFDLDTAPSNGSTASTFSTDSGVMRAACCTWVASPGIFGSDVLFKTRKRVTPLLGQYGNNSGQWCFSVSGFTPASQTRTFNSALNPALASENGFSIQNNVTTNTLFGIIGHWTADAEL